MSYRRLVIAALAGAVAVTAQGFAAGSGVDWAYSGTGGPEYWGALSSDYELCETGTAQSPIDIRAAAKTTFRGLKFRYAPAPLKIRNTGHTIQVDYGPGSRLISGNKEYELVQFHFHSPSEHTVAGDRFPMEVHLVHRAADGSLAVVGVLVALGAHHDVLHQLHSFVPRNTGEVRKPSSLTIDASAFLPGDHDYVRYIGSLTTPPCSENVQWHIMRKPIEASQHQFDAFLRVVHENARPVQPRTHRLVLTSKTGAGAAISNSNAHGKDAD